MQKQCLLLATEQWYSYGHTYSLGNFSGAITYAQGMGLQLWCHACCFVDLDVPVDIAVSYSWQRPIHVLDSLEFWEVPGNHQFREEDLFQLFSIFLPWRNPWNNVEKLENNKKTSTIQLTSNLYNAYFEFTTTKKWQVSNSVMMCKNCHHWDISHCRIYDVQCFLFFQSWSLVESQATSHGTISDEGLSRDIHSISIKINLLSF